MRSAETVLVHNQSATTFQKGIELDNTVYIYFNENQDYKLKFQKLLISALLRLIPGQDKSGTIRTLSNGFPALLVIPRSEVGPTMLKI